LKSIEKGPSATPIVGWFSYFYRLLFGGDDYDPTRASETFMIEFERQYGQLKPNVQPTFQSALSKCRTEYKFLLVYLHSPYHDDSDDFCRNVLCTEVITEFVNTNFLFWMTTISIAEGFRVSSELGASTYPFLAVLCYNVRGEPTLVDIIEGNVGLHNTLSHLTVILEQHGNSLQNLRSQRLQQDTDRQIRQEQDIAYKETLAADQERERKVHQEEEKNKRQIEEDQKQKEMRVKRRERLKATLPTEPSAGEKDITSLVFRFSDGSRLQRRFKASDKLQSVYDFLDAQENSELPLNFVLVTNFPRKMFRDKSMILQDAGLVPQSALFIEDQEE